MPEDPPQEPPGGPSTGGRSAASEEKLATLLNEITETASQLSTAALELSKQIVRLQRELHFGKKADNK